MKEFRLDGKVILITGASSGIGRACAIKVSEAGGSTIITGRDAVRLEETSQRLGKTPSFSFIRDLTDYSLIEADIQRAVSALGRIDGFIHSAGIEEPAPLRQMTPEKLMKVFNVNVVAGLELTRIISGRKYLGDSGASFIFVSSVMALLGQPGLSGYCSSKGALSAAVKALALELAAKKIRVNGILPGIVEDTEMTKSLFRMVPEEARQSIVQKHPLGLGTTTDVALLSVYLLSDASRWITGSEILIDGGYSAQ